MQIGLDVGLKMYGTGMQASHGDQTIEKPGFFDIVGGLKWESWEDYCGISKEFC